METKIEHVYHIFNNKIIDLITNVTYFYNEIDKQNTENYLKIIFI